MVNTFRGWYNIDSENQYNTNPFFTNTDIGTVGKVWLQIDLIDKYYVGSFEIYSVRPCYSKIYIAASNDLNTAWTVICNTDNLNFQDIGPLQGSGFMVGRTGRIHFTNNKGFFRYYRIIIDRSSTLQEASVQELLLYGANMQTLIKKADLLLN